MTGELITTGVTFGAGRNSINDAFSGTAEFNNIALDSGADFSGGTGGGIIYSGGTDLYNIFVPGSSGDLWSASTGSNSIITNNGTGNLASGSYSMAFGSQNTISGNYGIVSGYNNKIQGAYTTALGGYALSSTTSVGSFMGGGRYNLTRSSYTSLLGGYRNTVESSSPYSSAIGGQNNIAEGFHSSVIGGQNNTTLGSSASIIGGVNNKNYSSGFIGGGSTNTIVNGAQFSGIIAGRNNSISGRYSFIGGGIGNTGGTSSRYSAVVGGRNNVVNSFYSAIVGGVNNIASGIRSFIGGGYLNTASWYDCAIIGGTYNKASAYSSSVLGGSYNTAANENASVAGGWANRAGGNRSFVAGGDSNTATTLHSSVVGGRNNVSSGFDSSVLGGSGNTVSGLRSVIIGGTSLNNTFNDTLMAQNARLAENGGIIYSGGTDLYNIFGTGAGDITRVQPGTNITTGGTENAPIVSLNSAISLTSVQTTQGFSGGQDTNTTSYLGRAAVGYGTFSDYAWFSHVDQVSGTGYGLIQGPDGTTTMNAPIASGGLQFRLDNINYMKVSGTTGYVGIGQNMLQPTQRLHVDGSIRMVDGNEGYGKIPYDTGDGTMAWSAFTLGGGGGVSIDPYNDLGDVASSFTWNVSGDSTNYEITLTAATTTVNLTNVRNGEYGTIIVNQDAVGGRLLSLGTVNGGAATHRVANGGGGVPILTSTSSAMDILTFTYNGSIMYWTVGNDYT